jgi:hypothetical protein
LLIFLESKVFVADPLQPQPGQAMMILEMLYDYIEEFDAHFQKRSPNLAGEGKFCTDKDNNLVPETSP